MSARDDYGVGASHMSDVQAAVEAGLLAAESDAIVPDKLAAFVVPQNARIEFVDIADRLAKHEAHPARKAGTFQVHDAESFVAYIAKHGVPETEVWSDAQGQKVVGVINAHDTSSGEDAAGWSDHRVEYQVKLTDAWKAWKAHDGSMLTQIAFAEHIENRLVDITVPDAADILEIAQNFEANTNVAYTSATTLATGERQFVYREETDARAGKSGQLTIPKEFVVTIQPFEGAPLFPITARLRYRLRDGSLTIGYQLVRPDDILRAAFLAVSDEIKAGVGDTPVFHGTTA